MPTVNRQTESVRAAAMAAIQNRPLVDGHAITVAQNINTNAIGWLREEFKLLRHREDLAAPLERAAEQIQYVQRRLSEEARRLSA